MSNKEILKDQDWLLQAIQKAVHEQVEAIAEEEIAKAQAAIQKRMKDVLPNVVMKLMSHYEAMQDMHCITIRVRKDL